MKKNVFGIISLALIEVFIQLAFFWLAPNTLNRWIVYAFVTVMTCFHLVFAVLIVRKAGVRRSAAPIVIGSIVQLLILGASIGTLIFDTGIKNTLFLLLMLVVLYFVAVFTFVFLLDKPIANSDTDDNDRAMYGRLEKALEENSRQNRGRILQENMSRREVTTPPNLPTRSVNSAPTRSVRPAPPPLPDQR